MFALMPILILSLSVSSASSFTTFNHVRGRATCCLRTKPLRVLSSVERDDTGTSADVIASLNLTPELEKMTTAFSMQGDDKTRYKQLLFLANKLAPIDEFVRVPENKVPGCLSTVYIDCSAETRKEDSQTVVNFVGDSDGLLTKGLVALLVRGLSGCTADEIDKVSPEFIHVAKISQSLTPGRNNGFLNMLAVMKRKAREASEARGVNGDSVAAGVEEQQAENADAGEIMTAFDEVDGKPIYNAIMSKLVSFLKPADISLEDKSAQHAGHAGSKGFESGESHFSLFIVADAFEGLSLVKRHQLIYMVLGEIMPNIHALQISAKTSAEVRR